MADKPKAPASLDEVVKHFEQAVELYVRDAEVVAREVDANLRQAKKKSERLEYLFHLSRSGRTDDPEAELFGKRAAKRAKVAP